MSYSMQEYLRLAAASLHPALVSAPALATMMDLANVLPSGSCIFESRLGSVDPYADFLLRFTLADRNYQGITGQRSESLLPSHLRNHPIWQRLGDFCIQWAEADPLLRQEIMSVWLEFDLAQGEANLPIPSFFFDFDKHAQQHIEVTRRALGLLFPPPIPWAWQRTVERCITMLPVGGQLFSVGTMFSRQTDSLRLCMSGVSPDALLPFLTQIGWTGPSHEVEHMLQAIGGLSDHIALALDVGEQVLPTLGVEYHIEDTMQTSKTRWGDLFNYLVAHQHCLPNKRDAALAWLGYDHERQMQTEWPSQLRVESARLNPHALSAFIRRISHVKLVHRPAQPLDAKVYLEFMHFWLHYDNVRQRYVFSETMTASS